MGYTALQKMQVKNREKFENVENVGPKIPNLKIDEKETLDLKSAALSFLHNRCEGLRFSAEKEEEEERTGNLQGSSAGKNQIPYNMQMDLDRLCLERAIERFVDSGAAHDAFDVYFCYLEMFMGGYGNSRRMIELLSEFEMNSSSLLTKHRDHYSHSVYVFLLGLAIYETNEEYRKTYQKYYHLEENENAAAHHYLKYWGLSALFHDIGYPFELPCEQMKGYFTERGQENKKVPFLAYHGMEAYIKLSKKLQLRLKDLYGRLFETTNEVFAFLLNEKVGEKYLVSERKMEQVLWDKPTNPDLFGNFMDHGYFSATVLLKQYVQEMGTEEITKECMDALTAILMHNSLYKFSIAYYKDKENIPFDMELHPLAYMLMLCDELQCWDRTAYGRNSRTELHPMDCKFTFDSQSGKIQAVYCYDKNEDKKISKYKIDYEEYVKKLKIYKNEKAEYDKKYQEDPDNENLQEPTKPKKPKLKAYASMYVNENDTVCDFVKDIESIVDINSSMAKATNAKEHTAKITLEVKTKLQEFNNEGKRIFLSDSNFIHLYNFAVALNAQYEKADTSSKQMEEMFDGLSLEYKLSNVAQAKEFAAHLDEIDCFYTDRSVSFDMVSEFTKEELEQLGEREHKRWEKEKTDMEWMPAGNFETVKTKKAVREQTRMHKDLGIKYKKLDAAIQEKDTNPLNTMLQKLKEYDGIRVYRYRVSKGQK